MKGTVPEVKIVNKQKGRVSYENTYLVLAEHTTLTEIHPSSWMNQDWDPYFYTQNAV